MDAAVDGAVKGVGSALVKSRTVTGTALQADISASVEKGADAIRKIIADNPLRGQSRKDMTSLVSTAPVELIYTDVLETIGGDCGVLLIHDGFGTGKTAAAHIAARARCESQPSKFLVVSPGPACETGDEWFDIVRRELKQPKAAPMELAKMLSKALRSKIKTKDKFRINVEGLPANSSDFRAGYRTYDAILVLEDLNPTDLEDRNGLYRLYDEYQHYHHVRDRDMLGDAFHLIKILCQTFDKSNDVLVLVTTKLRRVGRTLHDWCNGGSKCRLARSLIDPSHGDFYCAARFNYHKHHRGFHWTKDSKMGLVTNTNPQVAGNGEAFEKLSKLAASKDVTVRDLCGHAAVLCPPEKGKKNYEIIKANFDCSQF